jgi:nucleolar protein 9
VLLVPEMSSLQDKRELRSKRSTGYKEKQGPMKSVFDSTPQAPAKQVPPEFEDLAKELLKSIRGKLSSSEVRALAADKVACVTLRVSIQSCTWHFSDIQP